MSGGTELAAILDVFRWGAGFAVFVSLLALLISLVALLFDRQPANNFLQILGITRRQAAAAALAEVMTAAAGTVALALFSSWLWALSLPRDTASVSLITIALPFVGALVVIAAAAGALVWSTLRNAGISVVPDRDGLVAAYDVFNPARDSN